MTSLRVSVSSLGGSTCIGGTSLSGPKALGPLLLQVGSLYLICGS